MKKIIVAGTSGSGKTTLARQLAEKLNITHIELDNLLWLPGWKTRPEEEFKKLVAQEIKKPGWTACGNYTQLMPITWKEADTVVWLDYPLWLSLWRALKRSAKLWWNHETVCNGNYESFSNFFSRKGIFRWVFKSYFSRKKKMPRFIADPKYKHIKFIRLRSPKETKQWLEGL